MKTSGKKQSHITIYDSFEAQKEDEIRASLKLSPQERLKQTVDLILRVYGT